MMHGRIAVARLAHPLPSAGGLPASGNHRRCLGKGAHVSLLLSKLGVRFRPSFHGMRTPPDPSVADGRPAHGGPAL